MRIAFYAPLKPPAHPHPSGDRRVARLYLDALALAGHSVTVASQLRSFDGEGVPERQRSLRDQAEAEASALLQSWQTAPHALRPQLWFSYHPYFKSPDWIGPRVAKALDIPYVVAEASFAPKRAGGPWDLGHLQAGHAIRAADLLICPTRQDAHGLTLASADPRRIVRLPPFLDVEPYRQAASRRAMLRERLAAQWGLALDTPWLLAVGMMRPGDKLASYRSLAQALGLLSDRRWQLLVAGDGIARAEVETALRGLGPDRVRYLGECDPAALAEVYAAGDLCVWPAVNEAFGMALLEAQAAGLPVVSCATRGVVDIVQDGVSGLLAPTDDMAALASRVRMLIDDPALRATLGAQAARHALDHHSLAQAAKELDRLLVTVVAERALP